MASINLKVPLGRAGQAGFPRIHVRLMRWGQFSGIFQRVSDQGVIRRMSEPVLDRDFLRRAAYDDVALMQEVLGLFRHQIDVWAPFFDLDHDPAMWRNAAHSLKGSARGVGAVALASSCEQLERLTLAPEPPGRVSIALTMQDIREQIEATRTETLRFDQELALTGLRKASKASNS